MGATQIYSVVNTIANNIGYTGATVVDVSSFVAFGQNGITGNVESVYNTLIASAPFRILLKQGDTLCRAKTDRFLGPIGGLNLAYVSLAQEEHTKS